MNYILLAIFIAIYLIGVVATIYQIYKITVIDAKARGIKHPKLMGLLATSGKSSEGIILYLLHRRKYPIKNTTKEVQNEIWDLGNIKKITSSDETVTTLINLANGIRIVTGVILLLLIFISIFIISNTIKLTVHARRKEISIMKYVGATNNFIRWPFIVEGMIIGVIASLISIILVGGAYSILAQEAVNIKFMQMMNMNLVSFKDMLSSIIVVYMLLGIGIGALGSVISMRKYLKV